MCIMRPHKQERPNNQLCKCKQKKQALKIVKKMKRKLNKNIDSYSRGLMLTAHTNMALRQVTVFSCTKLALVVLALADRHLGFHLKDNNSNFNGPLMSVVITL